MASRMGRPTNNPRTISLNIRLSEKEAQLLQDCADKLNTSRVNVIVKGIELVKSKIDKTK